MINTSDLRFLNIPTYDDIVELEAQKEKAQTFKEEEFKKVTGEEYKLIQPVKFEEGQPFNYPGQKLVQSSIETLSSFQSAIQESALKEQYDDKINNLRDVQKIKDSYNDEQTKQFLDRQSRRNKYRMTENTYYLMDNKNVEDINERIENKKFVDKQFQYNINNLLDNTDFISRNLVYPFINDVIEASKPTDFGDILSIGKTATYFTGAGWLNIGKTPVQRFLTTQLAEASVDTVLELSKRYFDTGEKANLENATITLGSNFASQTSFAFVQTVLGKVIKGSFKAIETPDVIVKNKQEIFSQIDNAMEEQGYSERYNYAKTGEGQNPFEIKDVVTEQIESNLGTTGIKSNAEDFMKQSIDTDIEIPIEKVDIEKGIDIAQQENILLDPIRDELTDLKGESLDKGYTLSSSSGTININEKVPKEPRRSFTEASGTDLFTRDASKLKDAEIKYKKLMEFPEVSNRGELLPGAARTVNLAETIGKTVSTAKKRTKDFVNYGNAKRLYLTANKYINYYTSNGVPNKNIRLDRTSQTMIDEIGVVKNKLNESKMNTMRQLNSMAHTNGYKDITDFYVDCNSTPNFSLGKAMSMIGTNKELELKTLHPQKYNMIKAIYENNKVNYGWNDKVPYIEEGSDLYDFIKKSGLDILEESNRDIDDVAYQIKQYTNQDDVGKILEQHSSQRSKAIDNVADELKNIYNKYGIEFNDEEFTRLEGSIIKTNLNDIAARISEISKGEITAKDITANENLVKNMEEYNRIDKLGIDLKKALRDTDNQWLRRIKQEQQIGIINVQNIGDLEHKLFKQEINEKTGRETSISELKDEFREVFDNQFKDTISNYIQPFNKNVYDLMYKLNINGKQVDLTKNTLKEVMDTGAFADTSEAIQFIDSMTEEITGRSIMASLDIDPSAKVKDNPEMYIDLIKEKYGIENNSFNVERINDPKINAYGSMKKNKDGTFTLVINEPYAKTLNSGQYFNFLLEEVTHFKDIQEGGGLGFRGNQIGTGERTKFNRSVLEKQRLLMEGLTSREENGFLVGRPLTDIDIENIRKSIVINKAKGKNKIYKSAWYNNDLLNKPAIHSLNARSSGHFSSSLDKSMNVSIADEIIKRGNSLKKLDEVGFEEYLLEIMRGIQDTTKAKGDKTLSDLQPYFRSDKDMYDFMVQLSNHSIDENSMYVRPETTFGIHNNTVKRDSEIAALGQPLNSYYNSVSPKNIKKILTTTKVKGQEPFVKNTDFNNTINRVIGDYKKGFEDIAMSSAKAPDIIKESDNVIKNVLNKNPKYLGEHALSFLSRIYLSFKTSYGGLSSRFLPYSQQVARGRYTPSEALYNQLLETPTVVKDISKSMAGNTIVFARNLVGVFNEDNIIYNALDKAMESVLTDNAVKKIGNLSMSEIDKLNWQMNALTEGSINGTIRNDVASRFSKSSFIGMGADEFTASKIGVKKSSSLIWDMQFMDYSNLKKIDKEILSNNGIKSREDFETFKQNELIPFTRRNEKTSAGGINYYHSDFTNYPVVNDLFWKEYGAWTNVQTTREAANLGEAMNYTGSFVKTAIAISKNYLNSLTSTYEAGHYRPLDAQETAKRAMTILPLLTTSAATIKVTKEALEVIRNRDTTLEGVRNQIEEYKNNPQQLAKDVAYAHIEPALGVIVKSNVSPTRAVYDFFERSNKELTGAMEEGRPELFIPTVFRFLGANQILENAYIIGGTEKPSATKSKKSKKKSNKNIKIEGLTFNKISDYTNSVQFQNDVVKSFYDNGWDVAFNEVQNGIDNILDTSKHLDINGTNTNVSEEYYS